MGRVLLDTTDDGPSPAFTIGFGRDAWLIVCEVHAGGVWTLEWRSDSAAPWVPLAVTWAAAGAVSVSGSDNGQFRISGGQGQGARFVASLADARGGIGGPSLIGG